MVSAVFHSPRDASFDVPETKDASKMIAAPAPSTSASSAPAAKPAAPKMPFDWRGFWRQVLPPIFGLGLLVGLWAIVSISTSSSIPSPIETFKQAVVLFSDPFYRKGPNDQGVGWNVLMSLERVALGFGLAAAVGIVG